METEDELALEIATKVADREGVDVIELRRPLYETIDTDALQAVLESTNPSEMRASVSFTYCGYHIHVDNAGTVQVTDPRSDTEPTNHSGSVGTQG